MAKCGNCKFDQLKEYAERLEKLTDADIEELCIKCSKELAARLLALVIPRTVVGDYSVLKIRTARKDTKYRKKGEQYTVRVKPKSGKMGGTLRRGWTSKTHAEAASGKGKNGKPIKEYAASLPVCKVSGYYIIQIINPVEYASYVEFGHRTKSGGWVNGKYMLTISEERLKQISPVVLQRMINKKLHEVLNG